MTLQYLIGAIRKLNPLMDEKKEILGCISNIPYDYSNDQYRATLGNEVDRRCYDDEVKLIMRAA